MDENYTIIPNPKEQESATYFDFDDMFGEIPNAPLYRTLVLDENGEYYHPMMTIRCMMRIVGGYLKKVFEMDDFLFFAGDLSTYFRDRNYYLPDYFGNIVVLRKSDKDDFEGLREDDISFLIAKLLDKVMNFDDENDGTDDYQDSEIYEMEE